MTTKPLYKIYRYWIILDGEEWSYVGQTSAAKNQRCNSRKTGNGYKKCPKFWRAIQEYGWDAFQYEELWSAFSQAEAFELERLSIELLDSVNHGFNDRLGTKTSEETKVKIAKTKWKPVYQLDSFGRVVGKYLSSKEASQQTGINEGNINLCCLGKRKTAGGYSWSRTLD